MTIKEIKSFYELMKNDDSIQTQLSEADSLESFIENCVKIGNEKGYSFTSESLKSAITSNFSSIVDGEENEDAELSDELLLAVAGGKMDDLPSTGIIVCGVPPLTSDGDPTCDSSGPR